MKQVACGYPADPQRREIEDTAKGIFLRQNETLLDTKDRVFNLRTKNTYSCKLISLSRLDDQPKATFRVSMLGPAVRLHSLVSRLVWANVHVPTAENRCGGVTAF